jgi:hypothetical protein
MNARAKCDECQTLLEELSLAFDAVRSSSPQRRAEAQTHSEAFLRMPGGSEEAADELFANLPFRAKPPELLKPPEFLQKPGVRQAIGKVMEHDARTGHIAVLGQ